MKITRTQHPFFISMFFLGIFLLVWHVATISPTFDPTGKTAEELLVLEFNGDIIQTDDGGYTWNPEKEKVKGVPGPMTVAEKAWIRIDRSLCD